MRKHILSIGNSFSDDAHTYLYDILENDGIDDIVIANLYIGGCTLETHANNIANDLKVYEFKVYDKNGYTKYQNYSIKDGLVYTKWDYITMQQSSYMSGIAESYFNNDGKIYFDIIRNYCLENINNIPKFLFHETWSYEKGYDADTNKIYNYSQELMEIKIKEVFDDIVKEYKYFDGYIMNMEVVRNLRLIHGRPVTRDGFHLYWGIGRYAAGLMFAYEINKDSKLYSIKEYDMLNETEKEQAKEAVLRTINNLK